MPDTSIPSVLPQHVLLLLSELPLPRPTTIVDVGANPLGETPYATLLRGGGCHVVGFEPQTEAFAELERTKGPNETYHPHAVGDGRTHRLHLYRINGFTSFFLPHLPSARIYRGSRWTQINGAVDLPTVSLDAMPGLAPFDLLKIDIQGGEVLVFENAKRVLSEAVAVIVEVRFMQLYEGEPMLGGVDDALRAQGFMFHRLIANKQRQMNNSQLNRLHPRRTADQAVDGDAVYLRHPGRIEGFTDAQVMHLAVLAASVFHSHSTAIYALDELVRRGTVPADLPARYVDALPAHFRSGSPSDAAEPVEAVTVPAAATEPAAKASAAKSSTSRSGGTSGAKSGGSKSKSR